MAAIDAAAFPADGPEQADLDALAELLRRWDEMLDDAPKP